MANVSGYEIGSGGATGQASQVQPTDTSYWDLGRLKRSYQDYLGTKRAEIDEQQDARRFRHGSHWTPSEIATLNKRQQPVVWENVTGRKVNGIVGTLIRLKQDPKAYPRTPKHEEGAELATGALRYVLDQQRWDDKERLCVESAGVDGIGGVELIIEQGDQGDNEVGLEPVAVEDFFYAPQSKRHDFSDSPYMGVGKWLDIDEAISLYPGHEDELEASMESGSELSSEPDSEMNWYHSEGEKKRVRVVEQYYRHKGEWCYAVYTGSFKIAEGKSPFLDEKNKTISKYIMFSAYVDQDGDRYGLVRDMKPLNRELNMRKSKGLYSAMSRRIIAEQGAFDDIEVTRREAARSDGVIIRNKGFEAEFDDNSRALETEQQFKFYELNRTAIESIGPNIAVTGQGLESSSGRAIHLLQQAGLADLGPFIESYRNWKLRVYRATWNAIQRFWNEERWIRVTDDDDIAHFVQLNGVQVDPMTGMPSMVNAIGSLDVDILIDEGPDAVTQMVDTYDTLMALASKGAQIPPEILLELAPIQSALKQKLLDKLAPEPTPEMQQKQQVEMQMGVETVREKGASANLKEAQAQKTLREAQLAQLEQQSPMAPGDHPMKTMSEAQEKAASAKLKEAQTFKTLQDAMKVMQDIQLEPQRFQTEQQNAAEDREQAERMARFKGAA